MSGESCSHCGMPWTPSGLACGSAAKTRSLACLRIEQLHNRVNLLDTLLRDRPKFTDSPSRFLEWDERVKLERQSQEPVPVRSST